MSTLTPTNYCVEEYIFKFQIFSGVYKAVFRVLSDLSTAITRQACLAVLNALGFHTIQEFAWFFLSCFTPSSWIISKYSGQWWVTTRIFIAFFIRDSYSPANTLLSPRFWGGTIPDDKGKGGKIGTVCIHTGPQIFDRCSQTDITF